jgi:serine/threonine protein kinase
MAEFNENQKLTFLFVNYRHPNIICYKESFFDENNLCIIMELCDGGDVLQKIEMLTRKN